MIKPEIEQEKQLVSDAINAAENAMLSNLLLADEAMLRAHAQQAKDEAMKVSDDDDGTAQKLNEQAISMEEIAKQMEATRAEITKNPQKNFSIKVKNLQVRADSSVMHVESDLHEAEVSEQVHEAEQHTVKADAVAATKDKDTEKQKPKAAEKIAKEGTKSKNTKKDKAATSNKTITVVLVAKNAPAHTPQQAKHEHSAVHVVKEFCQEKKKEYIDPILHSVPVATAIHWGEKMGHAAMHPAETAEKITRKAKKMAGDAVDAGKALIDSGVQKVNAAVDSSVKYMKSVAKTVTEIPEKAMNAAKSTAKALLDKLPSMPTLPSMPSMTVLTGVSWLSFSDDDEEKKKPSTKTAAKAKPKQATITSAKQIAVVKKVKEVKIPAGISKGSQVAANDDLPSPRHVLEDEDKQLTHHS